MRLQSAFALLAAVILLFCREATAEDVLLPLDPRETVIGELKEVTARAEDSLIDIARRFDLGYDEIIKANPQVDRWVPGAGTKVLIPGRHVLPDAPRDGIVLNLAELRLFYFPPEEPGLRRRVFTYPISIGRMDWKSPLGRTRVAAKEKDPPWYPPESIRSEHALEGESLPPFFAGGDPENPLGRYALRLALPHYLIHGTDERKQYGIGMRVTHGCVRMYPEDIEELFGLVSVGTPVLFVDQPLLIGWRGAELYLEIHSPLPEDEDEFEEYSHRVTIEDAGALISGSVSTPLRFIPGRIAEAFRLQNGIPTPIATTESLLPPAVR